MNKKHEPTAWQKQRFEDDFKANSQDGKCMVTSYSHVLTPDEFGGDEYYYFPLNEFGDTRYWLCIRKDFVNDMDLTLKVEGRYVGKVLGRGGENIKKIAKQLGLRYIRVEKV